MKGANITGGKGIRGRAEDDFYATSPEDVKRFLRAYGNKIEGYVLEPCIGQGHIAKVLLEKCNVLIDGIDIKNRNCGLPFFIEEDFLTADIEKKYDYVITNPPYTLAEDFIRKSASCVKEGGKVIMFLKLQFLEGTGRKELFDDYPPKYIYMCAEKEPSLSDWEVKSTLRQERNGLLLRYVLRGLSGKMAFMESL